MDLHRFTDTETWNCLSLDCLVPTSLSPTTSTAMIGSRNRSLMLLHAVTDCSHSLKLYCPTDSTTRCYDGQQNTEASLLQQAVLYRPLSHQYLHCPQTVQHVAMMGNKTLKPPTSARGVI